MKDAAKLLDAKMDNLSAPDLKNRHFLHIQKTWVVALNNEYYKGTTGDNRTEVLFDFRPMLIKPDLTRKDLVDAIIEFIENVCNNQGLSAEGKTSVFIVEYKINEDGPVQMLTWVSGLRKKIKAHKELLEFG